MTIAVSAGAFFVVPTWPQNVKWVGETDSSSPMANATDTVPVD